MCPLELTNLTDAALSDAALTRMHRITCQLMQCLFDVLVLKFTQ